VSGAGEGVGVHGASLQCEHVRSNAEPAGAATLLAGTHLKNRGWVELVGRGDWVS